MSHLTFDERVMICLLVAEGYRQNEIAARLNRSPSTISRELRRNRHPSGQYQACEAGRKAAERRRSPTIRPKLEDPALYDRVTEKLLENWSPEQISGALAKSEGHQVISHQTIYNFLNCLPRDHVFRRSMRRKGKRNRKAKPGFLARMAAEHTSIHDRPKVVGKRSRIGDWELDLVRCYKASGYLVTAVERKSGYSLVRKVSSRHCNKVIDAILKMFEPIPFEKIKTFTFDNGTEFYYTQRLTEELGAKVYYADPYNSGQRGTNENTNGLFRQYFPKTMCYNLISHWAVKKAVKLINNRPRLRLKFQTPQDVFGFS